MSLKHLPRRQHVGRVTDADAKTTDTTQAADDALVVNVQGGSRYRFRATLFGAATANNGIDYGLSLPSGSSGQYFDETSPSTPLAHGDELSITGDGSDMVTVISGTFSAGEDGEFAITWAQGTSHADEAKVLAGSTLEVENLN